MLFLTEEEMTTENRKTIVNERGENAAWWVFETLYQYVRRHTTAGLPKVMPIRAGS